MKTVNRTYSSYSAAALVNILSDYLWRPRGSLICFYVWTHSNVKNCHHSPEAITVEMETMVITLCHCFYKAEKKKKRNILCGLKKLVIQLAEANWKMYRALGRRDEHQNTKMNQGKTGPFIIFLQIIKKYINSLHLITWTINHITLKCTRINHKLLAHQAGRKTLINKSF